MATRISTAFFVPFPGAAALLLCAGVGRAQEPVSFQDVAAIFGARCLSCHDARARLGALELTSYEGLMRGGAGGAVVVPGRPEESRLFLMISGRMKPAMPFSLDPLAPSQVETVRKWIEAGAKPPAAGLRIEPAPSAAARIPEIKPRVPVKAEIAALAFRRDGKLLAMGGFREVRLLDPETGKLVASLGPHAEVVRAVAFSPDGRYLAAGGGLPARFGEVRIWDVEARHEIRTILGHTDCIYGLAVSPDGTTLATSSYDKLIKLWDLNSGQEIRTLKDHIDAVFALAFTPDGTRLLSASADRTVKVWDPSSGNRLYTLGDSLDGLNTLAVDPSGKRVAAGGLDKTVRIWSLGEKSGALLQSLIAHEDAILKLAWSPQGNLLISSAADRTIKVLRAADLSEIRVFARQPDWVFSLDFAPDGQSFAAGRYDGSFQIFRATEFLSVGVVGQPSLAAAGRRRTSAEADAAR